MDLLEIRVGREEVEERNLWRKINRYWNQLSKETIAELEAVRDAASSLDAEILTSVRALGRYPVGHHNPQSEGGLRAEVAPQDPASLEPADGPDREAAQREGGDVQALDAARGRPARV